MPIVGQFGSLAGLGSLILPGGAMESIATITVGSGGASSIEFTNIGSGWQHLQIRMISKVGSAGTGGTDLLQLNGDTANNYARHVLYGDGASAAATWATSTSSMWAGTTNGTSATSVFGAAVIDILDYGSTSKNKTIRSLSGVDVNGSGGFLQLFSGLWMSTAAVTSLRLTSFSGNFAQHTTAALYGLKAP